MAKEDSPLKRIASDGAVVLAARDAFVQQLAAELPETRIIERIIHAPTSRVITFALLSEER
jgi:hypothetical protein